MEIDPEDVKAMEEYKKRATILENTDKTDLNAYLNGVGEEEEKTERTFSDIRSMQSAAAKDSGIKARLREYSVHHIQQIVADIIREKKIDQVKWGARLLEFV